MPVYFSVSESFDKEYEISTTNKFLSDIMMHLRESRPLVKEYQESLLTFYEGTSTVQLWIRTTGCTFSKKGSCTVCDYWVGEHLEDPDKIVKKALMPYKGMYETLIFNTSGSPFDYNELTYEEQRKIWKVIDSMEFQVIIIETHMDFVDTNRLRLLKENIHTYLVIEMGMESGNEQVLKYALNKKVSIDRLEKKIELIHNYGIGCCTNILLGIPFLNVKDRIKDCIFSIREALRVGADTCAVFPIHIKEFTLVEQLFRAGLYQRVNEWELVEVLNAFSPEELVKINIAWYKEKRQDNISYTSEIIPPMLCENCKKLVYELLTAYYSEREGDRRRSIINRLTAMNCRCKEKLLENIDKKSHELSFYYEKIGILNTGEGERNGNSFRSVLDCMKRNIKLYGNKLAVSDEQKAVTFFELHEKAGRMAFRIKHTISGRGKCIGIVASNASDTVVNILSVLYSGNYYIVLDEELPEKMFEITCRLADIKLIITNNNVKWIYEIPYICTDEEILETNTFYYKSTAEDPLYAVLTSGTTGLPRVVLKNYASMDIFIRNYIKVFDLTANEVIGGVIPFYSDASAKDIFCMIYLGAELFVIPGKYLATPYALVRSMNEKKVTMISWVPSAYSLVVYFDIFSSIIPEYLRVAFIVGEQIPVKIVKYWQEHLPDTIFYNTYGMSELAGVCAWYKIPIDYAERIPIGKPFGHCSLIFVDESLRKSSQGELLICSEALAKGYLTDAGLEGLSRIKIEDQDGISRDYYLSGDYGYLDEHENFVITGRKDKQIKYRGYRIELEGIESIMMEFSGVCKAVCIFDNNEIVAIVQLDKDTNSNRKEFELYCRLNLQKYMQPARYYYVDIIPLNGNLKIDRKYLQENWKGIAGYGEGTKHTL